MWTQVRVQSVFLGCLTIIFFHLSSTIAIEERCWSWSTCTGWFAMQYQCYTKVKPIEIPTEYRWLVQTACPKLGLTNYTCCHKERLMELYKYDNLLRNKYYLALCPQCLYNVMSFLCEVLCGLEGEKYRVLATTNWQSQREYYDLIVAWNFIKETYRSCKDIRLPHNNMVLMDYMCGQYNHYSCSPMRMFYNLPEWENVTHIRSFYRYIFNATKDKAHEPFVEKAHEPYVEKAYKCSAGFQLINSMPEHGPCKCRDCSNSCPEPGHLSPLMVDMEAFNLSRYRIENPKKYQITLYTIFSVASVIFITTFLSIYFCRGQDVSMETFNKWERGAGRTFKLMRASPNVQELADMDQFDDQFGVCFRSFILRIGAKISNVIEVFFDWWGRFWGRYPGVAMFVGLSIVVALSHGVRYLHVSMDPDEYIIGVSARSQLEKDFFDQHFEPYARINTIIVHVKKIRKIEYQKSVLVKDPRSNYIFGPAFNDSILLKIKNLTDMVLKITPLGDTKLKYKDFCFDPYAESEFAGSIKKNWKSRCVVNSVWAWFQNNVTMFKEMRKDKQYLDRIIRCTDFPDHIDCLPHFGRTVPPALVLGGFLSPRQRLPKKPNYLRANTHIIQFLFNNNNEPHYQKKVYEWEKEFTTVMNEWINLYQPPYFDVAFTAHSAHAQEAEDSPMKSEYVQDTYFLKFLFCALCWSTFSKVSRLVVDTRFMVAAGAVGIVYSSVTAASGLMAYVDGTSTDVIERMLPVLMLAIGANNLHLFAGYHWREKMKAGETVFKHTGRVLAQVGGAIFLTSILETMVLFVNRQNGVPSIWWFAAFATAASVINLLVVMTFGIGMYTFDRHRYLKHRFDILICIKAKAHPQSVGSEGILYKFFKYGYTPILMNSFVRCIVIVLFGWWFCFSLAVIPELEIVPMNKEVTLPKKSYIKKYYDFYDRYVHLGPELYFVLTEGFDISRPSLQEIVGMQRWSTRDSMVNTLYEAHLNPEVTTIALPPSSWFDDFIDWSKVENCCHAFTNGSFCPNDYIGERSIEPCVPCNITHHLQKYGSFDTRLNYRPHFRKYLYYFLRDHSTAHCIKGGLAQHSRAVNYVVVNNQALVKSFYFKTYFISLHTDEDMRLAMQAARTVAANVTSMLHREIEKRPSSYNPYYSQPLVMFAISPFFSKFELFNTIWMDLLKNVAWSCLYMFLVTMLLLGFDVFTALALAINQFMCVINAMAYLYFNSYPLNAYTTIFLIMSQAMFIAFASFISHAYSMSSGIDRVQRAAFALTEAGPAVLVGVTLGKFPGVLLFYTNYVLMYRKVGVEIYLFTILVGTLHGLVFFPVLLSFMGSARNRQKVIYHMRRKCVEEECPSTEHDVKSKLYLEPLDEDIKKLKPAYGHIHKSTTAVLHL